MRGPKESLRSLVEWYEPAMDALSWSSYLWIIAICLAVLFSTFALSNSIKRMKFLSVKSREKISFYLELIGACTAFSAILDLLLRNADDAAQLALGNNVLYSASAISYIAEFFGDYTNYVLFFFPFYVILLAAVGNKSLSKILSAIIGIWVFISIVFCLRYIISTFLLNPLSLMFFVLICFLVSMFNSASLEKDYGRWTPLAGLRLRALHKEANKRLSLARQGAMVGLASAFYLGLTISPGVQISYYMALLSGLLAIIGFLALIFTFTFEMLNSHSIRRSIAADTKRAQSAMMVLVGFSIVGLFVSDIPLNFDLLAIDATNIVGMAIFSFCVIGGAAAIDFTMDFFHRIVDFVTDNNIASSTGMSFAFAEMNTATASSSVSLGPTGLATMRTHLEEKGDRVLAIEKADAVSLRRLGRTVIVLPRVSSAVSRADAEFYRNFVKRGNGMLILADQSDVEHKKELLSVFGVEAWPVPKELEKIQPIFLNLSKEFELDEIGDFRPALRAPIMLRFSPDVIAEAKKEGVDLSAENYSLIFREVENGLVAVVGSIDHWANQNISTGDSVLFLDYMQLLFHKTLESGKALRTSE